MTEETALRLARAIERIADALEFQQDLERGRHKAAQAIRQEERDRRLRAVPRPG